MVVLVLASLMVVSIVIYSHVGMVRRRAQQQQREKDLQAWRKLIDDVITGKSDCIVLAYGGPPDLDQKLPDIEHLRGLRTLCLEGIDVTRSRLACISKVPDLRELCLYGGVEHLSNQDFEILNEKASIERLVLVYMDAHHQPLPALARRPNLRDLTIFDRVRAGSSRTKGAWYWLEELHQLKQLRIGGAGVTPRCLDHLRRVLPHTSIELLKQEPSMK